MTKHNNVTIRKNDGNKVQLINLYADINTSSIIIKLKKIHYTSC